MVALSPSFESVATRTEYAPFADMSHVASPSRPTPRVLVIPGLDGQTGLWRRAAPRVLPGLRPIWFDHSADRAEGGFEGLAQRALHALDADPEGDTPAYVCGESFGGPVALMLARRYPWRVRGLLLVSSFAWYPSPMAGQLGLAAWRVLGNRIAKQVLGIGHPFTLPAALGIRFPPDLARAYLRRLLGDLRAYRAKCELALHFDARSWLHEISHPTFVLVGRRDPIVPRRSGQAMANCLPAASLYSIAGGHLAWCVRPGEVGALVEDWLNANEYR
jgi:pimeloyl-ACP methyl ester carboxylesterase